MDAATKPLKMFRNPAKRVASRVNTDDAGAADEMLNTYGVSAAAYAVIVASDKLILKPKLLAAPPSNAIKLVASAPITWPAIVVLNTFARKPPADTFTRTRGRAVLSMIHADVLR